MEITDIKDFKPFFLKQRDVLLKEIKQVELDSDGDDTDKIQTQIIGNTLQKLSEFNSNKIISINNSLERIENGTFGICEECDDKIGLKRLMAKPDARMCISCAEGLELNAKSFSKEKRHSDDDEES